MGLFSRKEKPKADFSNVQSGSSTTDPRATPAPTAAPRTYTIQKGDTLSAIAQREYGNAQEWRAIYEANRDTIKDPDMIYPGQKINLPPRDQIKDERGGAR
jgi:nucleoid-associated protein YgaU